MSAAPAWELLAVRYATLATRKSEYYYRYFAYGEPDEPLRMDYFFWVLRRDAETVLVDTGFDPAMGAKRARTCLVPPERALAELGVEPASVSRVVLTHLHYDHTGNLHLFPEAELVVAARELDFWSSPLAERLQLASHVEQGEIDRVRRAEAEGRVRRLDGDAEILPGVRALVVGGHSPGQAMLLVETASGPVALASDAVHFYEELERDWPCAVLVDLAGVYAAYDRLRELAAGGTPVVAGHDPAVLDRFPRVEGAAAEYAVRVA